MDGVRRIMARVLNTDRFKAPEYAVNIVRVVASVTASARPNIGNLTMYGHGEESNPIFTLRSWDYSSSLPQFEFHKLGIVMWWDGGIDRSPEVNRPISDEECYLMLTDCIGYLHWQVAKTSMELPVVSSTSLR